MTEQLKIYYKIFAFAKNQTSAKAIVETDQDTAHRVFANLENTHDVIHMYREVYISDQETPISVSLIRTQGLWKFLYTLRRSNPSQ